MRPQARAPKTSASFEVLSATHMADVQMWHNNMEHPILSALRGGMRPGIRRWAHANFRAPGRDSHPHPGIPVAAVLGRSSAFNKVIGVDLLDLEAYDGSGTLVELCLLGHGVWESHEGGGRGVGGGI